MRQLTRKQLTAGACVLFAASLALLFLGLDSEPQPSTLPLCLASVACAAVSLPLWLASLRHPAKEKRRPGQP